jgi:general secretion pathway protein M
MIKESWAKLDTRQRYLVVACAVVVLLALTLNFAVFPLWDATTKTKKSVAANSKKLAEMAAIDAEFAVQDAKIFLIKNAIATRRTDFTLFSCLEKKAFSANVKGAIKQMNSMQGARSASFEETLIDMKLEKITIRQLEDFLYQVESPADLIKIKRITINKMKESPDYISAQLLIASYAPASPGAGGQ